MGELMEGKLITGHGDGSLRIFNPDTWEMEKTIETRSEVKCMAVMDGNLITGHADGFLRIPNLTTGDIRHTIAGHKSPVESMCVVGSTLYSASLKVRTCNLPLLFSSGVHSVQ